MVHPRRRFGLVINIFHLWWQWFSATPLCTTLCFWIVWNKITEVGLHFVDLYWFIVKIRDVQMCSSGKKWNCSHPTWIDASSPLPRTFYSSKQAPYCDCLNRRTEGIREEDIYKKVLQCLSITISSVCILSTCPSLHWPRKNCAVCANSILMWGEP